MFFVCDPFPKTPLVGDDFLCVLYTVYPSRLLFFCAVASKHFGTFMCSRVVLLWPSEANSSPVSNGYNFKPVRQLQMHFWSFFFFLQPSFSRKKKEYCGLFRETQLVGDYLLYVYMCCVQ